MFNYMITVLLSSQSRLHCLSLMFSPAERPRPGQAGAQSGGDRQTRQCRQVQGLSTPFCVTIRQSTLTTGGKPTVQSPVSR